MLASSLVDQNLDLIGGPRREPFERLGRIIELDVTRYDTLDREIPCGNLSCHPVEVVDPVTPGPDDRQIVQRPKHGLNQGLSHEQAGLGKGPTLSERVDTCCETIRVARALDDCINAEAVAALAQIVGDIDRCGIENDRDVKRLCTSAPSRIRLGHVDLGRSCCPRAKGGQRANRARSRDEHSIARANSRAFNPIGSDGRWFDERTLLIRHSIGKTHDLVLGNGCNLSHSTPAVGETDTSHGGAQVLKPAAAVRTRAAVGKRHDRNAITLPH